MWTAAVEKAIVKIDKRKDRKTCGSFLTENRCAYFMMKNQMTQMK